MPVEYAYLMASLPMLAIGKDIPMSSADFLASSTPLLKQEDAQGLLAGLAGILLWLATPERRGTEPELAALLELGAVLWIAFGSFI